MSQITQISLISRGFLKDIGQIRSGPPLKALFTSDRAIISRKIKYFKAAEVQDMKADLLFYQFHTGRDLKLDNKVSFNCDFESDFLGIDKLLEAEIQSIQKQSGVEDIESIIKQNHPDWTDQQIQDSIKLIKEYNQSQQQKVNPITQSTARSAIQQNT